MSGHPIPCPVLDDAGATIPQLHAAAAADLAQQQAYTREQQQHGGPGQRDGVLPGGDR